MPKYLREPESNAPRRAIDPQSYLQQTPVWRFADFDWDGPWGDTSCTERAGHLRGHIEHHLASFETMQWREILAASGGKGEGKGNNHHEIDRDKLSPQAIRRLDDIGVAAESIFSLRLENVVRLYGVREGNCLRLLFYDPYHDVESKGVCPVKK